MSEDQHADRKGSGSLRGRMVHRAGAKTLTGKSVVADKADKQE